MKQKKKSPIKTRQLREPGQWLREQLQDMLEDKVIAYMVPVTLVILLAMLEWLRMFFNATPSLTTSVILSISAIIASCWYACYVYKNWHQYRNMQLGMEGELSVGQYLEETLAAHNYHILHDIQCNGFNIDHVVIGLTGIFCVETKAISKPVNKDARVRFDGEKVTIDGFTPDRDPIKQVKSSAYWLHDCIKSFTGKSFFVHPIVVFPGWFVEKMSPNVEVWVLNEKVVPTFIQNAGNKISPDDVSLIFSCLKQYALSAPSGI